MVLKWAKKEKSSIIYFLSLLLIFFNISISFSQIGNALVLDGCSNYFEIQDNDLLDYNNELSIECWIRPNCEDGNKVIISKEWCQDQYGYYLSVNNGRLFWSYSLSGNCSDPNNYQTVGVEIPTNQFTHVAVVHTNSEIQLFINGIKTSSEQFSGELGSIINSSEPFRIGAYKNIGGNTSNYFSGLIDEIRVWDTSLNETLIQQRMDSPLQGDEAGLILYLNMEDIGLGNSLILNNQSTFGTSLNAFSSGFTATTPYIIDSQSYDAKLIDLGDDLVTCSSSTTLSIPVDNYKNITWSDGTSDNELSVFNSGIYSVEVETELCNLNYDTIQIELSSYAIQTDEYWICENDSITVENITYYEAGIFTDTIPSLGVNCDTIVETVINIFPTITGYVEIETCPNSIVNIEGTELAPGDIYSITYISNNGCDSVVTFEVTPDLIIFEEINLTACTENQIEFNDSTFLPNTSTDLLFTSSEGCDSILTIIVESTPTNDSFLGNDTSIC